MRQRKKRWMGRLIFFYLVVFCSVMAGCGPALLVGLGAAGAGGYIMRKGVEREQTKTVGAPAESQPVAAVPTAR